jgi:plastocyanin
VATPGKWKLLLTCLLLASCGGGSSPSSPTPPSNNPNVFTFSASGVVSPKEVTVSPGSRVLFRNNDSRRHNVSSDPHPDHTDCPELNQVDYLNPGQERETGNLVSIRTCGFHDHDDFDNNDKKGRIIVR